MDKKLRSTPPSSLNSNFYDIACLSHTRFKQIYFDLEIVWYMNYIKVVVTRSL